MKNKIIIFLLLLSSLNAFSQVKPDISHDDSISYLGHKFYIHKIKQGESILAIINTYHRDLTKTLKLNKQLFGENEKYIDTSDYLIIPADSNLVLNIKPVYYCCKYKIGKRESLYNIAQRFKNQGYTTSEELIVEHNPILAKKGPKKGMIIKIPVLVKYYTIEDDYFFYHYTHRGETFYYLEKIYDISKDQIIKYNPKLNPDRPIPENIFVAIPKNEYTVKQYALFSGLEVPDLLGIDPLYFEDPNYAPCEKYQYHNEYFNIALLLPLYINENHLLLPDFADNKPNTKLYANSEIFYQYYFGLLLALDDLQQLGINIHLHVYDTRNSSDRISNILSDTAFNNMDLIIGPVYAKHYDVIREFGKEHRINVVSPLTRKNHILDNNPFVFEANPSDYMLERKVAKYLSYYPDSNIVVVLDGKQTTRDLVEFFKKELNIAGLQNSYVDSIPVKEVYFNPDNLDYIKSTLTKDTTNYVVVPSNDEVAVTGILNYLNALASIEEYKIEVIGMPTWEKFRNIDYHWIRNMKIIYPSAFYLDNTKDAVIRFKNRYLETYKALPSIYSFMGYDEMMYFAMALKQYGKYFQFCLTSDDVVVSPRGISMNFNFVRKDSVSGFENNAVRMIYYDENLKIKVLEDNTQE